MANLVIALARSVSAAVFALLIAGSLLSIVLIIKFDLYQHRYNRVRAVANSVAVIILSSLAAVSQYAYSSLGTGALIAYLEFTLLFLVLLWNTVAFVVTTYESGQKEDEVAAKAEETHLKELLNKMALSNLNEIDDNSNKNMHHPQGALAEDPIFYSN